MPDPRASPPKRILLAEDDPEGVELTLAALAEVGLADDVETVSDGQEVLDYLHRRGQYQGREPGNPAVILLDLRMPRVTGLEALEQIRSDTALSAIPVAVLTSSREESDVAAWRSDRVEHCQHRGRDGWREVDTIAKLRAAGWNLQGGIAGYWGDSRAGHFKRGTEVRSAGFSHQFATSLDVGGVGRELI